jgi:hypothetical protein
MHRAAGTFTPKAYHPCLQARQKSTSFTSFLAISLNSLCAPNKIAKTYNSGYSLVVTHLTTNPPVHCLSTAERTGSSIFSVLWSYVEEMVVLLYIFHK